MPTPTMPLHDDQSYYVLMRNRAKCAKLLKAEPSELTFVKGIDAVFDSSRKRNDFLIGCQGLEELEPVRVYQKRSHYPTWNDPAERCLGIQHFRCHSDKNLEYLLVSIPLYHEDVAEYVVCKKGDLYKVARHNKRISVCDLDILKPVLDEQLIADVLKNTHLFAKNAKKIKQSGIRLRRGVILDGKPGNGKTMLCAYIDSLCQRDNLSTKKFSSAQVERAYLDGKLEKLFWSADVIFFDDMDVSFLSRASKHEKIATNILTAMDGLTNSKNCVVRIFTTNENLDNLDEAFMRPGRIDAKFGIDRPTAALRRSLIEQWPQEVRSRVNISELISLTEGLSFSQVEEIRSKMVINFYIEGEWNFERALDEFNRFNQELKQKKMAGFAA